MNNNEYNNFNYGGVNQTPPTQNNIQQPNKKSNKSLIIIILLLVVGIGAFVYFNGKNDTPTDIQNNNNDNQAVENTQTDNNSNKNNNNYIDSGNLTIATLGHVDHGKTTLTSAITKYFGNYVEEDVIDRAPEVNRNNVTFNASTVTYKTQNKTYTQYDFPGHADIVKSLVSGAVKLDGAILVVAVTDGPMPQTREHLKILKEVGVSRVVVYLNKCDLVSDQDLISLVEMEIRELLNEYGFDGDNTPIIRGSATKALEGDANAVKSIKDLMSSADNWIKTLDDTEKATSHKSFEASVYVLSKEEGGRHTPFFSNYNPDIVVNNSNSKGKIELPAGVEMVMPGDNVNLTVNLDDALTIKKGLYFQLKEGNRVVGVGIITKVAN